MDLENGLLHEHEGEGEDEDDVEPGANDEEPKEETDASVEDKQHSRTRPESEWSYVAEEEV